MPTRKTNKKIQKRRSKKSSVVNLKRQKKTEALVLTLLIKAIFVAFVLIVLYSFNFFAKPIEKQVRILETREVLATAYSSTIDQTDATPCITANGYNLCEDPQENVIAANFLPFNTKIRIPEVFGDQILTVQDRMNARYGNNRIDVWLNSREKAKNFGIKVLEMEIVELED